jgi:hypothetical protein
MNDHTEPTSPTDAVSPSTGAFDGLAEFLKALPRRSKPPVATGATYETLLGAGRGLWANDAEFEAFLESIRALRRGHAATDTPSSAGPAAELSPETLSLLAEMRNRTTAPKNAGTATYESLLGAGTGLWGTDEEFEAFLASIRAIREVKE